MRIDITSLCFGFKITKTNDSGTPAWATSIGQAPKNICYVDTKIEGLAEFVYGMMYKSHSDFENLKDTDVPGVDKKEEPRSDRERMMFSVFEDVYVNNMKVDGIYTLTFEREDTISHKNRLHICYAKYLTYKNHSNKATLVNMAAKLGCTENACWFVTDISIKNQKNLHFTAIVVDPIKSMTYEDSKSRKRDWESLMFTPEQTKSTFDVPLQQIFYGAPGTGKSNTIRKSVDEQNKVNYRVTFHPDSDYSTFVGCYKPTMKETVISKDGVESKEEQIVYRFVPQAFTKAYTAAWNTEEEVYLIIEEINRGNCAQIFGDLFQLLDRKNGFSEYPIDTDADLEVHICKELKNSTRTDFPEGVKEGKKLVLPPNLYIWATMNTSDQSLFPIDSAFKRRWDWHYMPIIDGGENWVIEVKGAKYDWWSFLIKINEQIGTTTSSEDKKLGYYFCKANSNGVIDAETFVGKVIFYLWNDVFKDYDLDGVLFVDEDINEKKSKLTFDKFYTSVNGETKVVEDKVKQFLKNLGVESNDEIEEDEDGNPEDENNPRKRNYDKFSIGGEGSYGKNRVAFECVKKYIERNPKMTASDVVAFWEKLNPGVGPHFIELPTEWDKRTEDGKKRSKDVTCGDDTKLYVLRNGYGNNGMVKILMDNVNGNETLKSLGLTIEQLPSDK